MKVYAATYACPSRMNNLLTLNMNGAEGKFLTSARLEAAIIEITTLQEERESRGGGGGQSTNNSANICCFGV